MLQGKEEEEKKGTHITQTEMAEGKIPVIDISPFLQADPKTTAQALNDPSVKAVVDEIRHAGQFVGFLIVTCHGIPQSVIDNAFAVSRAYFDLPVEEKRKVSMRHDWPYGYSGFGEEILSASDAETYGAAKPDLKETFQICLNPMSKPVWPALPEDCPAKLTTYYQSCNQLARMLLRIFAVALNQSIDFFEPLIDRHWSALRSLNYPHQANPPPVGSIRASAHSDYGTITILRQDDAPGGLQVLNKDGSWQDVITKGMDAFIVNLGDLFQRWTDNEWKSTVHRVINAPRDPETLRKDTRRQSIAFFHNLNEDALVGSLTGKNLFSPIQAGEYLMQRHASANKGM